LELQAVGTGAFIEDSADGVGERGDFAEACGHAGDAFVVELEAVEHGGGKAALGAGIHVFCVGGLDRIAVAFESVGHGEEAGVFFGGGELRQFPRGGFGLFGQDRHMFQ